MKAPLDVPDLHSDREKALSIRSSDPIEGLLDRHLSVQRRAIDLMVARTRNCSATVSLAMRDQNGVNSAQFSKITEPYEHRTF